MLSCVSRHFSSISSVQKSFRRCAGVAPHEVLGVPLLVVDGSSPAASRARPGWASPRGSDCLPRTLMYFSTSLQSSMNSAGRAMLMSLVPRTAIALRPLSPITAPMPQPAGAGPALLDGGEEDPVLAGQADGGHLGLRLLQLLADQLRGLAGALAAQVSGVADLHLVVVDPQIDQLGGLAAEDHLVVAGVLQLRRPESAHHRDRP